MHTEFSNAAVASNSLEEKKPTYFFVLKTVSRPAYNTRNKEEKNCMPKMEGLFRCQEVCVMVIVQMREEG